MQRRQFLSVTTASVCLGPVACGLTGCGTLLHNERVGQPHTHQIDWKIAALDGLGMLLFFVPGVVAFVVDFYTGAIYVPYDEYVVPSQGPYQTSGPAAQPYPNWSAPSPAPVAPAQPLPAPPTGAPALQPATPPAPMTAPVTTSAENQTHGLRRYQIPRDQLSPQTVQQVVSKQIGRPIALDDQQTRLSKLNELAAFHDQRQRHESDQTFGFGIRQFFKRFQVS